MLILATAALICAVTFVAGNAAEKQSTTDANYVVQPADNGQALVNPDMGWTMHFYSNIIRAATWP